MELSRKYCVNANSTNEDYRVIEIFRVYKELQGHSAETERTS